MEAFSGDGPAAVWATERRREPSPVRRPQSFSGLVDRGAEAQTAAPVQAATPEPKIPATPAEVLDSVPIAAVIEHLPGAVVLLDRNMKIHCASSGWAQALRLGSEVIVKGRSFYDFFEDCADYWRRQHHSVLAGERILHERDTFERPDGLVLTLERSMLPVKGPNGKVAGMLMTLTVEEMDFEIDDKRDRELLRFLEDR
jgi:PAS domain-containing protein